MSPLLRRVRRTGPALPVVLLTIGGALAPVGGQSPVFTDITGAAGVTFVHVNGASGDLHLPEVIGAGGALFDYDNDGDLDLFAVQGTTLGEAASGEAPRSRLFRNDLGGAKGQGSPSGTGLRFTDVTDASGLDVAGYGMSAATGDIDNDGWVDLYVTALGATRLLRNNRNGSFSDITAKSGTGNSGWTTSASFLDFDRDGWLDLYVTSYVNFRLDMKRECFSAASARDYCSPAVYEPLPDRLWRNNGNGTFTDVSTRAGIAAPPGRGLGVLATDVNGDGWTDLYVANDGDPNQLWVNQRNGTFHDEALLSGVAVSRSGQPQGSMGVDTGDIDGDGDEDLFVTNLDNEGNALYLNVGGGLFEERTIERGLFALGFTGFGTRFVDYDNDGWLDVVVANGAVRHLAAQVRRGDRYPLRQRNQLFRNQNGRFVDVSSVSGPAFTSLQVARGAAIGDLDNDGDSDLVVFGNNGPLTVHRNDSGHRRHWLGVRVLDGRAPRDALQARVTLTGGRRPLARRVQVDGSYAASSDPRVIFGLGDATTPQRVRVQWDSGRTEEFRGLAVDRYWILEPGKPPRVMR